MFFEIASIVSGKCINPETKKPYPTTIIMKTMRAAHISIDISKSTKKQALETIRKLKESNIIPIARAQMSVRVNAEKKYLRELKSRMSGLIELGEENVDESGGWEAVSFCCGISEIGDAERRLMQGSWPKAGHRRSGKVQGVRSGN